MTSHVYMLDPALLNEGPMPSSQTATSSFLTTPYHPALTAQTLMESPPDQPGPSHEPPSPSQEDSERSAKRPRLSPPDGDESKDEVVPLEATHYPPLLPPIMQVEKQQVTTVATQNASAGRRKNEANFVCPVPSCGSTFTRRFNLRGHLRSHTEERPFICDWPGCNKGFARQHDCKRHQALHNQKTQTNTCAGCKKTFSRLDALNRHLKSEGAAECRRARDSLNPSAQFYVEDHHDQLEQNEQQQQQQEEEEYQDEPQQQPRLQLRDPPPPMFLGDAGMGLTMVGP